MLKPSLQIISVGRQPILARGLRLLSVRLVMLRVWLAVGRQPILARGLRPYFEGAETELQLSSRKTANPRQGTKTAYLVKMASVFMRVLVGRQPILARGLRLLYGLDFDSRLQARLSEDSQSSPGD